MDDGWGYPHFRKHPHRSSWNSWNCHELPKVSPAAPVRSAFPVLTWPWPWPEAPGSHPGCAPQEPGKAVGKPGTTRGKGCESGGKPWENHGGKPRTRGKSQAFQLWNKTEELSLLLSDPSHVEMFRSPILTLIGSSGMDTFIKFDVPLLIQVRYPQTGQPRPMLENWSLHSSQIFYEGQIPSFLLVHNPQKSILCSTVHTPKPEFSQSKPPIFCARAAEPRLLSFEFICFGSGCDRHHCQQPN